jgi:hypothetical protein
MALVVSTLSSSLAAAYTAAKNAELSEAAFANLVATAIDAYIKTATVTVNPGQAVATTGSATAQTGSTTSPGTGSLS